MHTRHTHCEIGHPRPSSSSLQDSNVPSLELSLAHINAHKTPPIEKAVALLSPSMPTQAQATKDILNLRKHNNLQTPCVPTLLYSASLLGQTINDVHFDMQPSSGMTRLFMTIGLARAGPLRRTAEHLHVPCPASAPDQLARLGHLPGAGCVGVAAAGVRDPPLRVPCKHDLLLGYHPALPVPWLPPQVPQRPAALGVPSRASLPACGSCLRCPAQPAAQLPCLAAVWRHGPGHARLCKAAESKEGGCMQPCQWEQQRWAAGQILTTTHELHGGQGAVDHARGYAVHQTTWTHPCNQKLKLPEPAVALAICRNAAVWVDGG
ncbi:hypothetical protein HaLaN_23500 [Haematococcus lacustris]|uniref:Uncharacterized protein n=1 Tax=Haematococcus lacustris TaxID=44745 RepID=A0A699ZT45_HAELA|nr:hypothetical protein HaLaN_23500 [Haematococcus lacustris]